MFVVTVTVTVVVTVVLTAIVVASSLSFLLFVAKRR